MPLQIGQIAFYANELAMHNFQFVDSGVPNRLIKTKVNDIINVKRFYMGMTVRRRMTGAT